MNGGEFVCYYMCLEGCADFQSSRTPRLRTDHTPMEEYTKKCLALIMYQRGEDQKKNVKWLVLKSPQNSELYEEKARVFPEAVFAFTHRLPHQFLSSMVGMTTYTFLVSNNDSYGVGGKLRGVNERGWDAD